VEKDGDYRCDLRKPKLFDEFNLSGGNRRQLFNQAKKA
jgi:hypothetical protein